MPKRVLVADDQEVPRRAVQRILEMAGYEVITASDGTEALQLAIEQKPDLGVFDMTMPGLHGHEVCMELRKRDDELANLPVIMLTAVEAFLGAELAASAGVRKYLNKPVDPTELLNAVKEVIEQEKGG